MEERSIQVDSVVVATPLFPHLEHAGPAQVADQAPMVRRVRAILSAISRMVQSGLTAM